MRDGALTRSQGRPGSDYFIASWADKWKEQNRVRYISDWIGRQDLTSTQIMLLKYNQSHEMPPKFSPKLLQNAICRVDLVRFRAVICFWEFELQRSPHYSTKVIIWRNILFILCTLFKENSFGKWLPENSTHIYLSVSDHFHLEI